LSDILGKLREEVLDCSVHGPQTVRVVGFSDGTWAEAKCPACAAALQQARDEADQRRRRADAEKYRQRLVEQKLSTAAIPPRFASKTFADFRTATVADAKALSVCQAYVDEFPENLRRGRCMVIHGKLGTGKTHLACAILNDAIARYTASARYLTLLAAIRSIKATYRKDSPLSEEQALAALAKPDLLVFDEVGVQFGSDTERMIAFEIINARYEAMKPTIIVSNLDYAGLIDCLGERAMDRLKENGGTLMALDGTSHRATAVMQDTAAQ
jgi:DNA replication protein DnaC